MTERIPRMKRVIVRGGRHVHDVTRDDQDIARTTCGSRRLRACDWPQLASEPVTCPHCKRVLAERKAARRKK